MHVPSEGTGEGAEQGCLSLNRHETGFSFVGPHQTGQAGLPEAHQGSLPTMTGNILPVQPLSNTIHTRIPSSAG